MFFAKAADFVKCGVCQYGGAAWTVGSDNDGLYGWIAVGSFEAFKQAVGGVAVFVV